MEFSVKVVKEALIDEVNGRQRNMAVSPLSIAALLRMLAVGSKGRTLEQLLGFLGCESLDNIKTSYYNLAAVAANIGGGGGGEGPLINFVNSLWFDQHYTLNSSFQQILTSVFRAEIKSLDIENKPDEAAEEINSWVNNATKGLIPVMVEKENIQGALIIANALYFKGAWESAFDASLTSEFNFHLLNGEKVQASFMRSYEDQFFRSFDSFKVVKLPYRHSGGDGRRFSMLVFLPNERDGLHKLLQEFSENPKLFLNQDLGLCWTSLSRFLIPKFKFSYYFEVSPIMGDLGLNLGELTEMIEHPNGGGGVTAFRVPMIVQNSRIEVNEEGTEAAAETDCQDMGCCLDSLPPPRPSFVADHPFLFMIKEDTSATPFFIGILFNPLD